MSACSDCLYYNKCYTRIAYCMDVDESTGKLIMDIENRCTGFTEADQFINLADEDVSHVFMYATKALGAEIRRTKTNQQLSPNDKFLSNKYVRLKKLYELSKDLRIRSSNYSTKGGKS